MATRPRAEINLPLLASRCSGSGRPWNDLRPLAAKNPPNETATIWRSAPLRLDNLPVEGVSCFKAYVYFPGYDLVSRAAGNNFRWCGNCFSPGKTEARLPFCEILLYSKAVVISIRATRGVNFSCASIIFLKSPCSSFSFASSRGGKREIDFPFVRRGSRAIAISCT